MVQRVRHRPLAGFRALRVWLAFKAYGADAFGRVMDRNLAQARRLADAVDAHPDLERLAPVGCDVVCLRYAPATVPAESLDEVNAELVLRIHESGVAIVSDTVLDGALAVRVAISNHRTRDSDLDLFLDTLLELGAAVVDDLGSARLTAQPSDPEMRAMAWARLRAPRRRDISRTSADTVRSETPSSRAISRSVAPSTRRIPIRTIRGV